MFHEIAKISVFLIPNALFQNSEQQADIAILCAAVADYRPIQTATQKIKKHQDHMVLELERTPDILASMRREFHFAGTLVGFAAETNDVLQYGREKLIHKQMQ